MTRSILLKITLLLCSVSSWSQYVIKTAQELENLKKVPQEKVYINHTGAVVFAGEYLYYALYCFDAQRNKLTGVSKLAYVALVNDAHEYVFEHKLKLDKGLASGDFFISTNVPSGTYKLLGYTQWMKNNGLAQVFQDDVVVINPYTADQSKLQSNTTKATNEVALPAANVSQASDSIIRVTLDKNTYSQREKVKLSVANYKGFLGNGSYSVKVLKKDAWEQTTGMDAVRFAKTYFNADKEIKQQVGDSLFLPEQRGELFFGTVLDQENNPVADKPVVISVIGKEFLLKFSQTDSDGNFYAYLKKEYKLPTAMVQVEDEMNTYTIKQGVQRKLDLDELRFKNYTLSENNKDAIVARSVRNQIENQFFSIKPDSVLQTDVIDPFDGGTPETILLDDYTRFATFEETILEIIPNAGYRNGGKKNDFVKVAQDYETFDEETNSYPSIIVIDGVFIPNHEQIRTYDARGIEKISLIRDKFRLGGTDYQGLVAVETYNGDYAASHTYTNSTLVNFDKPEPVKNYYNQRYDEGDNRFSRIPDYRTLLFWKPQVTVDSASYDFEFFTSDVLGEYIIVLDGFTSYGKPITQIKTFTVTEDINVE